MSNTGIPRVNVAAGVEGDDQPEVDVSDEEFLQFDTTKVPVIVTLTKVILSDLSLMSSANFHVYYPLLISTHMLFRSVGTIL